MNASTRIAPVRKAIIVNASPLRAFTVFTDGIDRWWPKSHGIGTAPVRASVIEPFVGGRWYAQCEDGSEAVVGHVRVWKPGQRFVVSWEISAAWKPASDVAYASEVELRFTANADGTTTVELEHRDFERMGAQDGETMRKAVDGGWLSLLSLFQSEAKAAERGSQP
jgi:uncharacterized protein YndB with AHSA1/START domain